MSELSTLAVDRYQLGPVGTNCYVVRASLDASEAVVIDPSGELPPLDATVAAILITHGH